MTDSKKESQWTKRAAALNPGETLCVASAMADAAIEITANASSWDCLDSTFRQPDYIINSAHVLTLQAVKLFISEADPDSWPDAKAYDSLDALADANKESSDPDRAVGGPKKSGSSEQ